jgi:hypothetical protein
MVVLTYHLTLVCTTTRPCMGRAQASPTDYFGAIQMDEMVGLETESCLI